MGHVGFGTAEITPKPGSQSPGGMAIRRLENVVDPLRVVAMVVRSEASIVAIVGIDALFIPAEVTGQARAAILRRCKIPVDNVLIGASHTHSGGPIVGCFASEPDAEYQALVASRIADAVEQAASSLHDAEIGQGAGHEASISFNRRFLMRDGTQVTHPGKQNPKIVAAAGPIDPTVGVLAARVPGGDLLGIFVHFACHLTIGRGQGFSADYVCDLRDALRAHYGRPDLPVGFLAGACGDVTQVDNLRPGSEFGPARCAIFGRALGAEVAQAIERITWIADPQVKAIGGGVEIPIRDEAEIRRPGPRIGLGSGPGAEEVYPGEQAMVLTEKARSPRVRCEVQGIRVGELAIVTNGAEVFCQLGLDIKSASPIQATWVATMANDWIGYVPTASAYYAGGYEPRTARSAKLAAWAGQALVETSLDVLGRLV